MITYERYAELMSKRINRTIVQRELEDIANFEAAQPEFCPKCNYRVRSQFMPSQIAHDIDTCSGGYASSTGK